MTIARIALASESPSKEARLETFMDLVAAAAGGLTDHVMISGNPDRLLGPIEQAYADLLAELEAAQAQAEGWMGLQAEYQTAVGRAQKEASDHSKLRVAAVRRAEKAGAERDAAVEQARQMRDKAISVKNVGMPIDAWNLICSMADAALADGALQ